MAIKAFDGSFNGDNFWWWIAIILGSVVVLALAYCFCLDPLWHQLKRLYRYIFKRPDPDAPPPPPPPKAPEPFQHWYMHDVLELDQHDMEMMAPDGWEGRGHVPPKPGPHEVGYVQKGKKRQRHPMS